MYWNHLFVFVYLAVRARCWDNDLFNFIKLPLTTPPSYTRYGTGTERLLPLRSGAGGCGPVGAPRHEDLPRDGSKTTLKH